MAVLLALLSAVTYGTADYLGGLSSRRAQVLTVLATTQSAGLAILLVCAPLAGGRLVGHDILLGVLGGVAGVVGLLCFYRSLAIGPMSLAAPVSAVVGAVIPVAIGLARGERPGPTALVGIPLALGAIVLFSRPGEPAGGDRAAALADPEPHRAPVVGARFGVIPLALAAGVGFGLIFTAFGAVSEASGIWPVVAARAVSVILVLSVALLARAPMALPRAVLPLALPAGVFDALANVFVLLANRYGLVAVVSVVASLYPASTVVLAQVFLNERFTRVHAWGATLATAAVILVAAG